MKGFTLLEVMIALAIMAGTVMTVIASYNHHLSVVARDRDELEAVLLARGKLEAMEQSKGVNAGEGSFAPARPDYAWKVETASTGLPGLTRVTLTVYWNAKSKKLSLVHYIET